MPVRLGPRSGQTISTARTATGSVGGTSEANVVCTLDPPMPNDDYAVTADVVQDANGEGLRVRRVKTKTATQVVVNVVNNAITSQTGDVHVVAVHA